MKHLGCMLLVAGLGLAVAPEQARAQRISARVESKSPTTGEWALLPDWCIDSQDGPYGMAGTAPGGLNKSPRAAQWVQLMGDDFWHMHHYCRGLRDVLRLNGAMITPAERNYLQERAVNEFEYIIKNAKPTMPLMPEVLLKRGEVQVLQGNLIGAKDSFDAARRLKPDYWPAYDRLSGMLIGLKQYERAAEIIEAGLTASPGQAELLARQKSIKAALRTPQRASHTVAAAASASASAAK